MTLAQLRYLVAIIDAGLNVTEAAARVNATQSGLSQQLKLLEEELGFQVFVRRGRKLDRISDAGAAVIDSARLIVAETHNIDALAANQRGEAEGDLRIFTTQAQAQYVLPAALAGLRQRFPDVRVQLSLDVGGAGRSLADASFDMAIVSAAQPDFAGAAAIPLYRWSWRLMVPAGHPLTARRGPIGLDELSRLPLIGFETAAHRDGPINRAFAQAGLSDAIAYSAPDSEVIKAYVRSGLGVGLLPEMAAQGLLPGEVALQIDQRVPPSITWAVVPPDRVLRDYALDLLGRLAPRLSHLEIQRLVRFAGACPLDDVPPWQAPLPILRLAG